MASPVRQSADEGGGSRRRAGGGVGRRKGSLPRETTDAGASDTGLTRDGSCPLAPGAANCRRERGEVTSPLPRVLAPRLYFASRIPRTSPAHRAGWAQVVAA
jgi:hypothetical protein